MEVPLTTSEWPNYQFSTNWVGILTNPPCGKWGLVLDYIHRLILDNVLRTKNFKMVQKVVFDNYIKCYYKKLIIGCVTYHKSEVSKTW